MNAADILPGNMRQSSYHRVDNEVNTEDGLYRFTLGSDFGAYDVISLALLKIRVHEVRTLARATALLQREERPDFDSVPGQLHVTGSSVRDILTSPLNTSSQLAGQFTDKMGRTLGGEVVSPGGHGDQGIQVSSAQRRNMARQLDLDVYSSNPEVQRFLDAVTRARTSGRIGSLTPMARPASGGVQVAGGVVDAEIKARLKNLSEDELVAFNRGLLMDMGIDPALIRRFLTHPAYSHTHRTSISVYLAVLEPVANRDLFLSTAVKAVSEADALAYQQLAFMLTYYHENISRLRELRAGGEFPLAVTAKGRLLLAMPVDIVYWTGDLERSLGNLTRYAGMADYRDWELITTGTLTNTARDAAVKRGFRLREKLLGG
ncbi:MAG: hypothetical protein GY731_09175 [Gammaproteobacteria bacterium]|nr:hypothetical protein [Gammaproteobacteria bacterium]